MAGREKAFLQALADRSNAIRDKAFVIESWKQLCQAQQHSFMSATLGHGRVLRRLNRNGRVVNHWHGEQTLRTLRNSISCEAHREMLLTVLDQYLKNGT